MEDFLNGTNKWTYCQFLTGYGFPGRCGPNYREWYQSSEYVPTCPSSTYSYKTEIYWFIFDQALSGEKYQPEWYPSELSSGLPFLFTSDEDVELEHVHILGAGADSSYSLSINRPSTVPLKNLSILNGMGNAVQISGKGSYFFKNLAILSDTYSSGNGVYVHSNANCFIDGFVSILNHPALLVCVQVCCS